VVLGPSADRRPDCEAVHDAQPRGWASCLVRSAAPLRGGAWCQPATGSGAWLGSMDAGIVGVLVGLGCDVADRGMDPRAVVEGLDVVEDCLASLVSGGEALAVDELDLESRPEALRAGVVMAVAAPAHADGDAGLAEFLPVIAAGILAAPIAVMDQALGRPAIGQRHVERSDDQGGLHGRIHGPADDLARVQIEDGGEVEPALVGADVGDVGHPLLVRRGRGEIAVDDVVGDRRVVVGIGGDEAHARRLGMEACLPHQPSHPLAADPDALVTQGGLDAWTAIGLAIGGLDV